MLKIRNSILMTLLIRLMSLECGRDFKDYFDNNDYGQDIIKRLEYSKIMQLKQECEIILKAVINVMDESTTQEVTHDESSDES